MNKRLIITILISCLILTTAGCKFNSLSEAEKRMGYCFDVAYDPVRGRLFVAAGKSGLHVFDVLEEGRLEYITTHYDGGYYRNIKLKGSRAFIADAERGLVVLDISQEIPETKWIQGGIGAGLHIESNTLYLAAGTGGFYIFDITNPDEPSLHRHFEAVDQPWDVWVDQGIAYLADVNKGLVIIDVTSPAQPHQIGFITWDIENPMAEVIRGEGNYVYIASGKHGLVVVDVFDPSNPVIAAKYDPGPDSFGEGLFVSEDVVFLSIGDKEGRYQKGLHILMVREHQNGLHILDVNSPYSPMVLDEVVFDGWVEGVSVAGDFAFVTNTWSGVRVINVQDLKNATLVDHFASLPEASN